MQKTLLGMDRGVMPRQLSQLIRPPLLRDLAYKAHAPVFRNHLMVLDRSAPRMQWWYLPLVLLLVGNQSLELFHSSVSTSAREGGSVLMLRPSEGSGFAASLGCGGLGTSLTCSTHLAACSFSVVITFPFSFLTGLMWGYSVHLAA